MVCQPYAEIKHRDHRLRKCHRAWEVHMRHPYLAGRLQEVVASGKVEFWVFKRMANLLWEQQSRGFPSQVHAATIIKINAPRIGSYRPN